MSFFGKKFKKVKEMSVIELLERTGFINEVNRIVYSPGSITLIEKNDDGSFQFICTNDGETALNEKVYPNMEKLLVTPSGVEIKVMAFREGNVIKSFFTLADGRVISADRYFYGDTMKMEIHVPGVDIIGVVDFVAIP